MKTGINKDVQEKALAVLNDDTRNASESIVEVIEMLNNAQHDDLIAELQAQNETWNASKEQAKKLGLRTDFTMEERSFYDKLIKQEVTFTQSDIIPETIVDRTLDDVKSASETLKLIDFAPAGVQKWVSASHSGVAAWGGLTDALTAELSAEFTSLSLDVTKLHVMLVVPKAVRDLAMPFVDKYFSAILAEAMHDGLVDGYLNGDGKTGPIGILNSVETYTSSGTAAAKDVNTITDLTIASLGEVKKYISNDGKRTISKLYLIANPLDVYEYVEPAMYVLTSNGYMTVPKTPIEIIEEPMMAQGTAVFTIEGMYTMGMKDLGINEYKEVKAIEDCDTFIAKIYANGRPVDDTTAYVFDVTALEEFVFPVKDVSTSA